MRGITPNGVKVDFANNVTDFKNQDVKPILVFDEDGNLLEVNLNGLYITK